MGEGKRTRERIEEIDFSKLESMTLELSAVIRSIYECEVLENTNWPHRYICQHESGRRFELIFSAMGSFTLRPVREEGSRKTPAPIFYMSVGKYTDLGLVWEDIDAVLVESQKDLLRNKLEESISKYLGSF